MAQVPAKTGENPALSRNGTAFLRASRPAECEPGRLLCAGETSPRKKGGSYEPVYALSPRVHRKCPGRRGPYCRVLEFRLERPGDQSRQHRVAERVDCAEHLPAH